MVIATYSVLAQIGVLFVYQGQTVDVVSVEEAVARLESVDGGYEPSEELLEPPGEGEGVDYTSKCNGALIFQRPVGHGPSDASFFDVPFISSAYNDDIVDMPQSLWVSLVEYADRVRARLPKRWRDAIYFPVLFEVTEGEQPYENKIEYLGVVGEDAWSAATEVLANITRRLIRSAVERKGKSEGKGEGGGKGEG